MLRFGDGAGSFDFGELSRDGKSFWTASRDGSVTQWDLNTGRALKTLPRPPGTEGRELHAFRLTPEGEVRARLGECFVRWDREGRARVASSALRADAADVETFSKSGRWLAYYGEHPWIIRNIWGIVLHTGPFLGYESNPPIVLIDADTGTVARAVASRTRADHLAFSPDERYVAVGRFGRLYSWDLETGRERKQRLEGTIHGLTFSADGGRIFAAVEYEGLLAIDPETLEPVGRMLEGIAVAPAAAGRKVIALSVDGDLLAENLPEGGVSIWETATGRAILRLDGHSGPVSDLALLPDGRRLVSLGRHGTGILWDLESEDFAPAARHEEFNRESLIRLWNQLGDANGLAAYQAYLTLLRHPGVTVPLIESPPVPDDLIRRLIGELDDDDSFVRTSAFVRLEKMSIAGQRLLMEALEGGPSTEVAARLRRLVERLSGEEMKHEAIREETAQRNRLLTARRLLKRIGTPRALALEERLGASDARHDPEPVPPE